MANQSSLYVGICPAEIKTMRIRDREEMDSETEDTARTVLDRFTRMRRRDKAAHTPPKIYPS